MNSTAALPADVTPPSTPSSLRLDPWSGLLLSLLAGAAIWGLMQGVHPVFQIPEKYHAAMGARPEVWEANGRASNRVDRYHAMLYVGGLGLCIGLALGVREGMLRRAWLFPLAPAVLGGAGGTLGGFLGCLIVEYVRTEFGQADLMHTIAAQAALGLPLGLGVGFGLGMATRTVSGTAQAALGGAAAALLAAIIYPVAVSVLLPETSTDALLPAEAASRLLWLALLSGLVGLFIPIAARRRKRAAAA